MPRKRFIQLWVRSTTQRRALARARFLTRCASLPLGGMYNVKPNSWAKSATSSPTYALSRHRPCGSAGVGSGRSTGILLRVSAASPIVLALQECDEALRAEAIELFKQLAGGELDEEARFATTALLAEILFPNADDKGYPGLDLVEAEALAPAADPAAMDLLAAMDEQEAVFANRLRERMEAQGLRAYPNNR